MASAVEFPDELCAAPMPLVALTGLDVTYNAVHRSIWDAFSNNRRTDRLNLSFACLEGDHQYPPAKAKRMSYDWYIPKGLLKTSWMKKHLKELPAVVVVFFELDWDDLAWRERHLACASRVEVIRSSLQNRMTKVAVVLIQKSSPLPPGEDMIAAERAAALCSACDLSAKSLFVLPHTDHLIGYVIRLENAFYELAQNYYHTECRRVKSHKEFLNKTTHQLLFPRHQFKIAFLSEMMQEPATALKHYQQSYNHIHELRLHDSNNLELKVVGGFVNYKICKLCFLKLNTPIDAITQFQRHIDLFKSLSGNKELLFEHSAWLSKQFSIFGDLFSEAINAVGLAAVQTQHPGFYYQRAAYYAQVRKQLASSICGQVKKEVYPGDDPLLCEKLEYFGQRPWRQGHQRIDLSDTSREKEGVLALKLKELEVDHPRLIIPLLSSAVSQCKKFHCPRLKRYLTIELGKEYYYSHQYERANTLLKRATSEYRQGSWPSILTNLLVVLLDCAFMTIDIMAYFACSSELIGRMSQLPLQQKSVIQDNLSRIIGGSSPKHVAVNQNVDQRSELASSKEIAKNWKKRLSDSTISCTIDIAHLKSFIECRVIFAKPQYTVESCVKLFLCICVTSPKAVEFSEMSLAFADSTYDKLCIISDKLSTDRKGNKLLRYDPWQVRIHQFEFPVASFDVSKSLLVQNVCFKMLSSDQSQAVALTFQKQISSDQRSNPIEWTEKNLMKESWLTLPDRPSTLINERESKLCINFLHKAPALVGEIFPITLQLRSNESEPVVAENVMILVSIQPESDDVLFQNTALSLDADQLSLGSGSAKTAEFSGGNLVAGEGKNLTVYVKSQHSGSLSLSFRISYKLSDIPVLRGDASQVKLISCSSSSTSNLLINVVQPFSFTSQFASMTFDSISGVNIKEPFLVLTTLTSRSCWPIQIVSGVPLLSADFRLIGESSCRKIDLSDEESVTDCMKMVCDLSVGDKSVVVGSYVVQWKRTDSEIPSIFSTTVPLPTVEVRTPPLLVRATLPAFGTLRKPSVIKYEIENKSLESKQLEVTYDYADAFMFAGPKQTNNFLPPKSSFTLSFNLIPLLLGFQALPQLRIRSCKSTDGEGDRDVPETEDFDISYLPSHLTVKPAQHRALT